MDVVFVHINTHKRTSFLNSYLLHASCFECIYVSKICVFLSFLYYFVQTNFSCVDKYRKNVNAQNRHKATRISFWLVNIPTVFVKKYTIIFNFFILGIRKCRKGTKHTTTIVDCKRFIYALNFLAIVISCTLNISLQVPNSHRLHVNP